ncbi:hypothetical protein, partial [uncultured Anaerococcus sp.]|uniref:hypothetical protein n=1 Tax=uncultured Anaerococcus sp. TaxID=293428 RepID=UPI0025CC749E
DNTSQISKLDDINLLYFIKKYILKTVKSGIDIHSAASHITFLNNQNINRLKARIKPIKTKQYLNFL